jgi:hypothetical protein
VKLVSRNDRIVFPDGRGGWRDRLVDGSRTRPFTTRDEATAAARRAIANAGGGSLTVTEPDGSCGAAEVVTANGALTMKPPFTQPHRDDFGRAVFALGKCFAEGHAVLGRWTEGTIEVWHEGRRRSYRMLEGESAMAFCKRVCQTEPRCDATKLAAYLG